MTTEPTTSNPCPPWCIRPHRPDWAAGDNYHHGPVHTFTLSIPHVSDHDEVTLCGRRPGGSDPDGEPMVELSMPGPTVLLTGEEVQHLIDALTDAACPPNRKAVA